MRPTCSTSSPPVSATPARELGRLSLMDALALVVLYARVSSPMFEPAAVRWLAPARARGARGRTGRRAAGGRPRLRVKPESGIVERELAHSPQRSLRPKLAASAVGVSKP